jgi:hypothetical protein
VTADNRDIARWFTAPKDDPNGFWHTWPMEDVTCAACGTGGCLMYPDPSKDDRAPEVHRPSTVCPNCSTSGVESYLRFAAEHKGFTLKPISVFGVTRPGPVQRMQNLLDKAEPECKVALEECWGAIEGGSDWTSDFESGGDGRVRYKDDGPRPSFALALLFDVERHMRGESTALVWTEEPAGEQLALEAIA